MELFTTALVIRWAVLGLRHVGVPDELLGDWPERLDAVDRWVRFPYAETAHLWDAYRTVRGDHAHAIDVGFPLTDDDMYVVQYFVGTAPDLRASLDACVALSTAVANTVKIHVHDRPDGSAMIVASRLGGQVALEAVEFALGACLRHVLNDAGDGAVTQLWTPRTGSVRWPDRLRAAAKSTGEALTAAVVPAEVLAQPMEHADAYVHEWARTLLPANHDVGLVDAAYRFVTETLGTDRCTLGHFARSVHYSVRTTQRVLRDEGTSFDMLLDTVRRSHALDLLRSDLSVDRIARRLGYESSRSFTRAFARWTNRTPTQWRSNPAPAPSMR